MKTLVLMMTTRQQQKRHVLGGLDSPHAHCGFVAIISTNEFNGVHAYFLPALGFTVNPV